MENKESTVYSLQVQVYSLQSTPWTGLVLLSAGCFLFRDSDIEERYILDWWIQNICWVTADPNRLKNTCSEELRKHTSLDWRDTRALYWQYSSLPPLPPLSHQTSSYFSLVLDQSWLLVNVVWPHPLCSVHDHHLLVASPAVHGLHPTCSLHHAGRGVHWCKNDNIIT